MARKIDLKTAPVSAGTDYPPPFDEPCLNRSKIRLGRAAGLTQFGVNLCRLPPGSWSAQRHWHTQEDELIYVLAGEVVLVTDDGEEVLYAGDCASFRAGDPNGHHFQNRSAAEVVLLEVGSRAPASEHVHYPDIDLRKVPSGFQRVDGSPYPAGAQRS